MKIEDTNKINISYEDARRKAFGKWLYNLADRDWMMMRIYS
jgi:hypothetical protein